MTRKLSLTAGILCVAAASLCCYAPWTTALSDENRPLAFAQAAKAETADSADRKIDMRSKLKMVQQIVEGIATEDYEMIDKGGMELLELAESAAWKSAHEPYYKHYSTNFEHSSRGLIQAAKSKSIEKATFAYIHVTISCTGCHQHVRNAVRTAR